MGYYSSWHIVCHVRSEFVSAVEHFIEHEEWPEPAPPFIAEWRHFLVAVERFSTLMNCYDYVPPAGCDSCWGQMNELRDGHIWHMAGCTKNYNREIGVFLTRVLTHLSDDIQLCRLTDENREEAYKKHMRLFPNDKSDVETWYTSYKDAELRKENYRHI